MATMSNTTKVCATCNFWSGSRQVKNIGMIVECSDMNSSSGCNHPTKIGMNVPGSSSCGNHAKWGPLK